MHWGTGAPKFEDQQGNIILLDKAKVLQNEPVYHYLEQPSVINGFINHIHKGYWWLYVVRIHVFKYDESIKKTNELLPYLGKDVYLYRHREADPFKNSAGEKLLFRIQEVTTDHLDTPDFRDIIDIKFKSTNYVDVSKSILPENVAIDSDRRIQVDSDGKYQLG